MAGYARGLKPRALARVSGFIVPLIEETERRRSRGLPNLFSSHMFDGSSLPLKDNLDIAVGLLERCNRNELILEIEAGVVGGEEDGVKGEGGAKLYTTPEDMIEVANRMNSVKGARYLFAATFGNVHGVYKPGHVKLKPSILRDGQEAVIESTERTRGLNLYSMAAPDPPSMKSARPSITAS